MSIKTEQPASETHIQVIRHNHVCKKLQISSAKLFDMCAQGLFPKPFRLIPGGRAVGWLEHDVDAWILQRKDCAGGASK